MNSGGWRRFHHAAPGYEEIVDAGGVGFEIFHAPGGGKWFRRRSIEETHALTLLHEQHHPTFDDYDPWSVPSKTR